MSLGSLGLSILRTFGQTAVAGSASSDAPAISYNTAGDGSVTINVVLNDADDAAYVIYCVSGNENAWSAPSESFKAVADGTVEVTSLTNATKYEFAAVSKVGTVYSLPSVTVTGTPTAGASISPEEALRSLLISDTDVAALVTARVYPENAPQGVALPFIVYTVVSGDHDHHMSAASGNVRLRFQIDCYHRAFTTVRDLGNKVRLALDGYAGTVTTANGSLAVQGILLDSDSNSFRAPDDGSNQGIRRVSMDFIFHCAEVVPTFS